MNLPIYLDYNATTPVAPEAAEAIIPYLQEHFGNPSSAHVFGQRAKLAVAQARAQSEEIVLTGSATEAKNLVLIDDLHPGLRQNSSGDQKKQNCQFGRESGIGYLICHGGATSICKRTTCGSGAGRRRLP